MKVLFVCKGNVGRSQALREFTERIITKSPELRGKVEVDSAGTDGEIIRKQTADGMRTIPPGLVDIYQRVFGITPRLPDRKEVTEKLAQEHDLILVAEPRLKKELHARFPEHALKILTVKEYLWRSLGEKAQVIDDVPQSTTRRYGSGKGERRREKPWNLKEYKMLKECRGLAERLVERWKSKPIKG